MHSSSALSYLFYWLPGATFSPKAYNRDLIIVFFLVLSFQVAIATQGILTGSHQIQNKHNYRQQSE